MMMWFFRFGFGAYHRVHPDTHHAFRRSDKCFRTSKHLLILLHLLFGQTSEVFSLNTADKKGSRNHIVILQHTVQRQTHQLSLVIADYGSRVFPGVKYLYEAADYSLHFVKFIFDLNRPGCFSRFYKQYFHSGDHLTFKEKGLRLFSMAS